MSDRLRIILTIAVLAVTVQGIRLIHRRKLKLGFSLMWLVVALVLLLAVAFPDAVVWLTQAVGIELPINMVLTVFAGLTIMLLFCLTSILSREDAKIRSLIQQIGLLEERVRELEGDDHADDAN